MLSLPLQAGIYSIATPLGNLGDITMRALEILTHVDLILCEDTRVSQKLCRHYGLKAPLKAFHEYTERSLVPTILDQVRKGAKIALISDAGTPLICDPGYILVREALGQGLFVTAAPGPCALINGLALSGLPPHPFFFGGFLPSTSKGRLTVFEKTRHLKATLVFYETPQRIKETLQEGEGIFGARQVAVIREMTKKFEEVIHGSWVFVKDHFDHIAPRGEMVLVIGPPSPEQESKDWDGDNLEEALRLSLKNQSLKGAVEDVHSLSGLSKKVIYQKALEIQRQNVNPTQEE